MYLFAVASTPIARGLALPLLSAAAASADGGEGGIAGLIDMLGSGGKLMAPHLCFLEATCRRPRWQKTTASAFKDCVTVRCNYCAATFSNGHQSRRLAHAEISGVRG